MRSFPLSPIALVMLCTLAGCESTSAPAPVLARLDVAETEVTLAVADTLRLSVSALDESGGPVAPEALLWTSSDPAVLSVDGNGVVRGRARGEAYAVATASGPAGSTLRDSAHVRVGSAFTIRPIAYLPQWGFSGRPVPVPIRFEVLDRRGAPARGVLVTFTTPTVGAAVSPTNALTDSLGTVSTTFTLGPGTGIHTMLARLPGGETSGHSMAAFDVIALRLSPDSVVLGGQGCVQGMSVGFPTTSGERIPGGTVAFEVADPTVAEFDVSPPMSGGYNDTNRALRARKAGETRVIASFMGISDTARVRVLPERVQRADYGYDETIRIRKGETRSRPAVARTVCGAAVADYPVTYTSLSPSIASVDDRGAVTGLADGFASIVATAGGGADTIVAQVRTYVLLPADTTVQVGDTVRYRVMTPGPDGSLVFVPGSDYFVRLAPSGSINPAVRVTHEGLATALSVGEAEITAFIPPLYIGWNAPIVRIRVVPRSP